MLSSESKASYLSAFSRYRLNGGNRRALWLDELRESAIASFESRGFPTTKNEEWKYTNVEPITSLPFEPRKRGAQAAVSQEKILLWSFTDPAHNRLVFVDGSFAPQFSALRGIPSGVRIESLAQVLSENSPVVQAFIARQACHRDDGFIALNTAFISDGAFVFVPKGLEVREPLYVIFVSSGGEKPIVSYPRNLLIFEAGSQARIVESYVSLGPGAYLNNAVTEIVGAESATIEHYRLQRESDEGFHVGHLSAQINRNCHLMAHAITLGGRLVRNDVHAVLDGEGAECVLNGLYLLDGHEHVDNHTSIEHRKPHGTSLELYKGILSGKARGVFNGKILVHKAAQKTDARQTNKNLLLSADAVVNTKPQLEINADDVKCSHGTTIGQINPDALFYLRSRGLDLKNAQSLLSYAFASDVVGKMNIPSMRARLDDYLLTKFGTH